MGPRKGSRDLDYTLRAADTSIQFFIFCIFNDQFKSGMNLIKTNPTPTPTLGLSS